MKSIEGVGLSDVKAVYDGAEGDLWELLMGQQIHIGGFKSSMELAERAGIGAGQRGVDLCCCSGAGARFLVRFRDVASMIGVDATETVVGSLAPSTLELVKKLVEEIRETSVICKGMIRTSLFGGVIGVSDWIAEVANVPAASTSLFQLFSPPIQDQLGNPTGADISDWYWFAIEVDRKQDSI